MNGPKIDIGLADDEVPRVRRPIDRKALQALSEDHGFDRSVAKPAPAATPTTVAPIAVDGRTLRATGRNTQMNAKVLPDVREGFMRLAIARNMSVGELLGEALDMLRAKYPHG